MISWAGNQKYGGWIVYVIRPLPYKKCPTKMTSIPVLPFPNRETIRMILQLSTFNCWVEFLEDSISTQIFFFLLNHLLVCSMEHYFTVQIGHTVSGRLHSVSLYFVLGAWTLQSLNQFSCLKSMLTVIKCQILNLNIEIRFKSKI